MTMATTATAMGSPSPICGGAGRAWVDRQLGYSILP